MTNAPPGATDEAFEREKWEKRLELRRREVEVKELEAATKNREVAVKEQEASIKDREQRLKNRELRLKIIELRKSRFSNPVFLAIIGATVAAAGTAIGAWFTARSQIQLEDKKSAAQQQNERFTADSTLILEIIKIGNDTVRAKNNLEFAIDAHLITDETRRADIKAFLASSKPIPTLPASTPTLPNAQALSVTCTMPQDVDLPTLAADIQTTLKASPTVSQVQMTAAADSATLVVELTVSSGGYACPTVGPRTGRVIISMRKTSGGVNINFDVGIPRLLWVAFSSNMAKDFVADLTKMLESKVGAGKVTCSQDTM